MLCRPLVAIATVASACGGAALGSHDRLPRLHAALADYGLDIAVADTKVAHLGWQPVPEACRYAYRIDTRYEPALQFEEDTVSTLVLGRDPRKPDEGPEAGAPMPPGEVFQGRVFYQGVRAERFGLARDFHLSGSHAGPSAPTAACMPKSWDPVEDALALGWPKLTERLTAVDEVWNGLRVEGACNKTPCIDAEAKSAADNHALTCVSKPWRVTLAGLYEIGGHRFALLESSWDDGHPEPPVGSDGFGIWTRASVLVSLEAGRPAWGQVKIRTGVPSPTRDHGFAPVDRYWELEAVDDCAGGLAWAGWARPADATSEFESANERFEDADANRSKRRQRPGRWNKAAEGPR